MKLDTGFLVGIGAGMMAGAAVGMMAGKDPMKTQVGRGIHKLGVAADQAASHIVSDLR